MRGKGFYKNSDMIHIVSVSYRRSLQGQQALVPWVYRGQGYNKPCSGYIGHDKGRNGFMILNEIE